MKLVKALEEIHKSPWRALHKFEKGLSKASEKLSKVPRELHRSS